MSLVADITEIIDRRFPKRRRPFACSFDLRLGQDKTFVVDANFFPAGWHHFSFPNKPQWPHHRTQVQHFFRWSGRETIAIVPEHHIQNEDYLKNLAWLTDFFCCCGLETYIVPITETGSIPEKRILEEVRGPCEGKPLIYFPYECVLEKDRSRLVVNGRKIDFALSQYDGSKSELQLSKTVDLPFYPPHFCSWQHRRKHQYFEAYHHFVDDVQKTTGADLGSYRFRFEFFAVQKNLKLPLSSTERDVLAVTQHWDKVIAWVNTWVKKPHDFKYWMLKSDHGTYGLGVEPVSSDDPIEEWSVRRIKRFHHGRHNMPVLGLVLQEGLPSVFKIEGKVAERVDYYFLGEKFGHFFRAHEQKTEFENLNRPGMSYYPGMTAMGDGALPEEEQKRLNIASILAYGGICLEYERILQQEERYAPERGHIA